MSFALWLNSLADIITPQYLTAIFFLSLLFSLPITWLAYRKVRSSILKDTNLYFLRRFIYWETATIVILVSLLLYNYPRL